MRLLFFMQIIFWIYPLSIFGQFYTAPDSNRIRPYSFIKPIKSKRSDTNRTIQLKEDKVKTNRVDSSKNSDIQDVIFGKLHKRLNVCLPLDFLKVNSKYGTRKDPITRCSTFHDGVDLACKKEVVYAMLPAVVKKVYRGTKGYGNYVILNHGRIECLYGHLDEITVKEKEIINAGTIVGISGNTGKSTGYHLHIRLRKDGKSVDPLVFILFLQNYIQSLNKELSHIVKPKGKEKISSNLTLQNVHTEIMRQKLAYPRIVLAQATLETGYFSSRVCVEYNNLFGLRKPSNGEYYQFERWEDSVTAYKDYVQYKYKGGNYYSFLKKIGYAEDKLYIDKVKEMENQLF